MVRRGLSVVYGLAHHILSKAIVSLLAASKDVRTCLYAQKMSVLSGIFMDKNS
jgi:hypothetical protein